MLDTLRSIVEPSCICEANRDVLYLKEEEGVKKYQVKLAPDQRVKDALLLKMDGDGVPKKVFYFLQHNPVSDQPKGLHRKVDYLLFCQSNTHKIYVYAIELKSKVKDPKWKEQVRAGLAFARYLIAFAEIKDKTSYQKATNIVYRGILFKEGIKQKKPKLKSYRKKQDDKKAYHFQYQRHEIYDYLYCTSYTNQTYPIDQLLPEMD